MESSALDPASLHAELLRGLLVACDADSVAPLVAPHFRLLQNLIAPVEPGARGLRAFTGFVGRGLGERSLVVQDSVVEDDRVATRFSGSALHAGPLGVLCATHRAVHYTGLAVSRFEGGVFTQTRLEASDAEVLRQLGYLRLRDWVDGRAD